MVDVVVVVDGNEDLGTVSDLFDDTSPGSAADHFIAEVGIIDFGAIAAVAYVESRDEIVYSLVMGRKDYERRVVLIDDSCRN